MEKQENTPLSVIMEVIAKAAELYFSYLIKSGAHKTAKMFSSAIHLLITIFIALGLAIMLWAGLQIIIFIVMTHMGVQPIVTVSLISLFNFMLLIITLACFFKYKSKLAAQL